MTSPGSRNRQPPMLEPELAAALGVARTARPRQVAREVLDFVGHDDLDGDPLPAPAAVWLRHLVELIGEHDWRTIDAAWLADRVAADSISDLDPDHVEGALRVVAPLVRSTGDAATTSLRRFLPGFTLRLVHALRSPS